MSLDNHKITTYADNVKDLPDYPSDEGYTAKSLKEIFDARSDKEIKEKHNALIDELAEVLSGLITHSESSDNPHGVTAEQTGAADAVNAHLSDGAAHASLFKAVLDRFSDYVTTSVFNTLLESKVDKIQGKGLSANDYTDEEKAEHKTMATSFPDLVKKSDLSEAYVARSHSCDVADAALNAQRADNAIADFNGNIIHDTYVTKEELPEASVFFAEWSEFADTSNKAICDENGNTIHEVYATKQGLESAMQDSDAVYQVQFDSINASIGDISSALDSVIASQESILAMQNALIGGDA
ncbi:MAG: hypothetical protein IJF32_11365 [Oscillospiraceae bacterium]|nr:hypothetical protein [Oscillospiraceae bacterium]